MRDGDRGGVVLRLVVALLVLAAAYVGMAVFLGRHVPANASVAGIPIGGKSAQDAEQWPEMISPGVPSNRSVPPQSRYTALA